MMLINKLLGDIAIPCVPVVLRLQECVSGKPQTFVLQLLQFLSELTELSGCQGRI